jgi:hypothetical protein
MTKCGTSFVEMLRMNFSDDRHGGEGLAQKLRDWREFGGVCCACGDIHFSLETNPGEKCLRLPFSLSLFWTANSRSFALTIPTLFHCYHVNSRRFLSPSAPSPSLQGSSFTTTRHSATNFRRTKCPINAIIICYLKKTNRPIVILMSTNSSEL